MGRPRNADARRKERPITPLADLAMQQAAMREITRARTERGMSLRELELASGVSPAVFADLAAMRRMASVRQVVQLADAVGLRVVLIEDPRIVPDASVPG